MNTSPTVSPSRLARDRFLVAKSAAAAEGIRLIPATDEPAWFAQANGNYTGFYPNPYDAIEAARRGDWE